MKRAPKFNQAVTCAVALLVALTGFSGMAKADRVNISELVEGQRPTVQVLDAAGRDVTAARVRILPDSRDEFLHFLLDDAKFGDGSSGSFDLWDDRIGGELSDRLWFLLRPTSKFAELRFCSDPRGCPRGRLHLGDAVETGDFQFMFTLSNTRLGNGRYDFFARSDVADIPEPSTLSLLGLGVLGIARRLRRKV